MHRVVCGWLVLGAVLLAAVASSAGPGWPVAITSHRTLHATFLIIGGWAFVQLLLGVAAIIDAVIRARRRDLDGLQRAADAVKLTAIWFFVINFVSSALLLWAVRRVGAGGTRWQLQAVAALVVFVVVTYLLMVTTSAYGIAMLVLMYRDRTIGKAFFGVNLVLHLIFVADVVSSVLVVEVARRALGRSRVSKPAARHLLTVVLGLCSLLAIAWLVLGVVGGLAGQRGLTTVADYLLLTPALALLLVVVVPVVPLVTLRTAVRLCLQGDLDALCRLTRSVKLVAIPLFVQNFLICFVIVLAATLFPVAASRGLIILLGPGALAIIAAFSSAAFVPAVTATYLMMLVTSCYGIACAALLGRTRSVGRGFVVTNVILHLVFVADVVSSLVLTHRAQLIIRPPAQAPVEPQPTTPPGARRQ